MSIQRSVEYGIECWVDQQFGPSDEVPDHLDGEHRAALATEIVAALFQGNDVLMAVNPEVGTSGTTTVGDTFRARLNRKKVYL